MAQLNLNVTPPFERDLRALMKARGFRQKSEAIRVAVHEAAQRFDSAEKIDFKAWIGIARSGAANPRPRFKDDDSLWER